MKHRLSRIATASILALLVLARPAAADLATGTVVDPDDTASPLDIASATLTEEDGAVTVEAVTHEAFADEQTAFVWFLQGRAEDNPDAVVAANYDEQQGEITAVLLADPGGTVTVSRPSPESIRLVFARSALGDLGALSFLLTAGDDYDGDGAVEADEADQAPDGFDAAVFRLAGTDRIETALRAWSSQTEEAVVLARSDDYADALAGVPLAVANRAPILLTASAQLDGRVRDAMLTRLPRGARVFLLGGPSALSPLVEQQLRDDGYDVVRLAGADRFDTSVVIARDGLGAPATVLLTTGRFFADALSAGAAAGARGGAVLLTDDRSMPSSVRAYLDANAPTERFAIGGPAAAADPSATPVVGGDRYETAVRVAETFFTGNVGVAVVSGENFPDALAAGPVAASEDPPAPVVLTRPTALPTPVRTYAEARRDQLQVAVVFGGQRAVTPQVLEEIETAIR